MLHSGLGEFYACLCLTVYETPDALLNSLILASAGLPTSKFTADNVRRWAAKKTELRVFKVKVW